MNFIELLKSEFDERRIRNSAYSVRAFAKLLQISPAALSLYFREKMPIPLKKAERLGLRLGFSLPEIRRCYLVEGSGKPGKRSLNSDFLSPDQFKLISHPLHFAVLGLAHIEKNEACAKWIAKMLDIAPEQADELLKRLIQLGLIKIVNKRFRQTTQPILTTQDIPNAAIRGYHQRTLQAAQNALDQCEVESREYSATTIAIRSEDLKQAKLAMRQFRDQFSTDLKHANPNQVYTLSLQFFPVSQKI